MVNVNSTPNVLSRPTLFFSVALAVQLRKVAACEAALERVVLEADEALGTYAQAGRTSSDQVSIAADFAKRSTPRSVLRVVLLITLLRYYDGVLILLLLLVVLLVCCWCYFDYFTFLLNALAPTIVADVLNKPLRTMVIVSAHDNPSPVSFPSRKPGTGYIIDLVYFCFVLSRCFFRLSFLASFLIPFSSHLAQITI